MSSEVRESPRTLLTALQRFLQTPLIEDPIERRFGGKVSGILWIGGGVVILLPRLLGGAPRTLPLAALIVLSVIACLWGVVSAFLLDWVDGPPWMSHLTAGAGVTVLTGITYLTGRAHSAGWGFFIWLALYGCFFFKRRVAVGLLLVCLVAQGAGVLIDAQRSFHDGSDWDFAFVVVGYGTVGIALIRGKEILTQLRHRAERDAYTDAITGLGTHRWMDRALAVYAAHAANSGSRFAVAVLDIDQLKALTQAQGPDGIDNGLRAFAATMTATAAQRDVLARTGGDEFTWLMPGLTAAEAAARVDALRSTLAAEVALPLRFSAGVADTDDERDCGALVRLAEGALYWSKTHGRNRTQVYDPEVVVNLSAQERADMLERSQTMVGLRALARAIDAKDPATQQHSQRVACVARALAKTLGWDDERAQYLHDAALVHDVGKIGIDDAVLRKPAMLTEAERAHVRSHAEISAQIVADVLCPEQVDWIRSHHERADGAGYPRGLSAEQIPTGGALLAIADAFDAMTAGRPYSDRREPAEALAICRKEAGRHFTVEAVDALSRWLEGTSEIVPDRAPVRSR